MQNSGSILSNTGENTGASVTGSNAFPETVSEINLDFSINGRRFICGDADSCWADLDKLQDDLSATNVYWTTVETENSTIIPDSHGNLHFTFFSFGEPQNNATLHFIVHLRPFNHVLNFSSVVEPLSFITNNNLKEVPINITAYGNIGEFIAGNFSGRFYEDIDGSPDITRPYDVTCSFRIKRNH